MIITQEQRFENLRKLSEYLKGLPKYHEQFGMLYTYGIKVGKSFVDIELTEIKSFPLNTKSVIADALGHGPAAGIQPLENQKTWDDYENNFIDSTDLIAYNLMFSSSWSQYKEHNTPAGTATRIDYYLATKGKINKEIDYFICSVHNFIYATNHTINHGV